MGDLPSGNASSSEQPVKYTQAVRSAPAPRMVRRPAEEEEAEEGCDIGDVDPPIRLPVEEARASPVIDPARSAGARFGTSVKRKPRRHIASSRPSRASELQSPGSRRPAGAMVTDWVWKVGFVEWDSKVIVFLMGSPLP